MDSSATSRIGAVVAGAASLRIDDGIARLGGATTIPSLRRRGVHRALVAARLRDARKAGCDIATLTAAPASQSETTAYRLGFELLYARAVLTKDHH